MYQSYYSNITYFDVLYSCHGSAKIKCSETYNT